MISGVMGGSETSGSHNEGDKQSEGKGKIQRSLKSMIKQMQLSDNEIKYRMENFDNADVKKEYLKYLKCTKCNANFQKVINKGDTVGIHPLLGVLMCDSCCEYYGDGNFSLDSEGEDKYCRWCGEGGTIFACSKCICGFCDECIKKHFGEEGLEEVKNDDDWICYFCNPKPLWYLRSICSLASEASKNKRDHLKKSKVGSGIRKKRRKKEDIESDMNKTSCDSASSSSCSSSNFKRKLKKRKSMFRVNDKRNEGSSSSEEEIENQMNYKKRLGRSKRNSTSTEGEKDSSESDSGNPKKKTKMSKNENSEFEKKKMEFLQKLKSIWRLTQTITEVGFNSSRTKLKRLSKTDEFGTIEKLKEEYEELKSCMNVLTSSLNTASNSVNSIREDLTFDTAKDETESFQSQEIKLKKLADKIQMKESDDVTAVESKGDSSRGEEKRMRGRKEERKEKRKSDGDGGKGGKDKNKSVLLLSDSGSETGRSGKKEEGEGMGKEEEKDEKENGESVKPLLKVKSFARMLENNVYDKNEKSDEPVVIDLYDMETDESEGEGKKESKRRKNTGQEQREEENEEKNCLNKQEKRRKSRRVNKEISNGETDSDGESEKEKDKKKGRKRKTRRKSTSYSESGSESAEDEEGKSSDGEEKGKCQTKKEEEDESPKINERSEKDSEKGEEGNENWKEQQNGDGDGKESLEEEKTNKSDEKACDEKSEKSRESGSENEAKNSEDKEESNKNGDVSDVAEEEKKKTSNDNTPEKKDEGEESSEEEQNRRKTRRQRKDVKASFEKFKRKRKRFLNTKETTETEEKKETKINATKILESSESENEKTECKNKKRKKRRILASSGEENEEKEEDDEEEEEKKEEEEEKSSEEWEKPNENSDSDEKKPITDASTSEDEEEEEKNIKKRKRIKRTRNDSSDSSEGENEKKKTKRNKSASDSSEDEKKKKKPKGRKNIKKILKKESLQVETKEALKNEEERKKRLKEREKVFEELFPVGGEGKFVLDFDPETKEPLVTVHKKLARKLKPHQVKGVKFMWDNCFESLKKMEEDGGSGCILAHCMGLGKTLQVVTLVHTVMTHDLGVDTALVVCPLSTVSNWVREFELWLGNIHTEPITLYDLVKIKRPEERSYQLKDWHENGGVLVLSYDLFRNLTKNLNEGKKKKKKTKKSKYREAFERALLDPGPDLVICDEGHLLKNVDTALSKLMSRIKTTRRVVLTGTPLQNNLVEYHCMVQFVKPNILGTRKEFCNRFVNPIMNGQFEDSTELDVKIMKRRSHVLHSMLDGCIQRFDYSVLTPFLPEKHEYVLLIALTDPQAKAYVHFVNTLSAKSFGSARATSLFHDFHILQKIWTHPRAMLMHSERETARAGAGSESEGSLKDFVVSTSEEEEEEETGSGSDSVEEVKPKKRILRSNANDPDVIEQEKEEEEEENQKKRWWNEFYGESAYDDLRESNKLMVLFSLLKYCQDKKDKVLVFSQSLYSLDLIEYFLAKVDENKDKNKETLCGHTGRWQLGADYFRLDGSTNSETRSNWCRYFNKESNTRARLFLISTRAGGLGINLYGANRVVIFDASWNPSHDLQSIFRVYRFGQKKPCYIYRFLSEGTMEEKIYERQVTKLSLAHRVVDEHQIERHYTMGNLQELYTFQTTPKDQRKVPNLPKDSVLADLLSEHKESIASYHEHDTLLENKEEEELSEEERKAAWKEYEEEKAAKMFNVNFPFEQQMMQQGFFPQGANVGPSSNFWFPGQVNAGQSFINPMYVQSNIPLDFLKRGLLVGVTPLHKESLESYMKRVINRESWMQGAMTQEG